MVEILVGGRQVPFDSSNDLNDSSSGPLTAAQMVAVRFEPFRLQPLRTVTVCISRSVD